MNILVVLFIVSGVTLSNTALAVRTPTLVHSSGCEDVKSRKRLNGTMISELIQPSKGKCALACNKNEACRSFNFCGQQKCELNREDIYSTESGEGNLEDDQDCNYFGMKRISVPLCQEAGKYAYIQNDGDNEENCWINSKRVDTVFGPWLPEKTVVDEYGEFKTTRTRSSAVASAHGGKTSGESEQTVQWLKFVKEKKKWSDAKSNCEAMGGKLFHRVNGNQNQLRFLFHRMNSEYFWLGISRLSGEWRNVDGAVVENSLLLWSSREPNGGESELYVGSDYGGLLLNDYPPTNVLGSVCDMV